MIASMLPGIIQGGIGLIQGLSGALSVPERPKYNFPSAIEDAIANAKGLAGQTRLPGQDKLEADIGNRTASYVNNLEKLSGGNSAAIGGLSKIYAQELNAKNQLGVNAAQYHAANQQQLQNAQRMYGQYQDKAFGYNIDDPYQTKAAASSALIGSGIQNFFQGGKDVVGVASYQSMMDKLFPKSGTGQSMFTNTPSATNINNGSIAPMSFTGGIPNYNNNQFNNPYGMNPFVTSPLNVGGVNFNGTNSNSYNPWVN